MNVLGFEVSDVFAGIVILFILLTVYALFVIFLKRKGYFEKYNLSLMGPALMWRTHRGVPFLKKVASKDRFWKAFGSTGIVLCFITMIVMSVLIVMNSWLILGFTPEQKETIPGVEFILAIPGINPIMPLDFIVYILIAFIVAIMVHEFSHGILTFASKLKVKSLGILYLIIPIGAFCEPDEEQLLKTKSANRMRIYSAGPTANFLAVLVSIVLISVILMSSVQPAADGVCIFTVLEDSPAEEIGLQPGMILSEINNTKISDLFDFFYVLDNTSANQTVTITFYEGTVQNTQQVILADRYQYVQNSSYAGVGTLGIQPTTVHKTFLSALQNPFDNLPNGFLLFWLIPFFGYIQGYNPLVEPFTDSFIITGPLSFMPQQVFWMIVNTIYWIFWLNFAVAIFNVIPIIPLDGGYLFKDGLQIFVKKTFKRLSLEEQKKRIDYITITLSLTLFFLIIFPIIFKYL